MAPNNNAGEELLNEFKESIKDLYPIIPEDGLLYAILLVSDLDKTKAISMLKQYMEMKLRMTKLSEAEFRKYAIAQEVIDNVVVKYLGIDSDGNHVIWSPVGQLELKKLVQKGFKMDIMRLMFKIIEDGANKWFEKGIQSGMPMKGVVLADHKGLSFFKVNHYETMQMSLELAKFIDVFFALCAKMYCINAPTIMQYLIGMVRPVVSASMLEKFEIMGSDTKKNLEIMKRIPNHVVPKEYGGDGPKVLV